MATSTPRFRVRQDNSGHYYWIFYGANGEEIARSSESYVAKRDCLHGVALVKRDGPSAPVYDWTVPTDPAGNHPAVPPSQIV